MSKKISIVTIDDPNNDKDLFNALNVLEANNISKLHLTKSSIDLEKFNIWLGQVSLGSVFKITMAVSKAMIDDPKFVDLLKTISSKSINCLELVLENDSTMDQEVEEKLIQIIPYVDFPIQIKNTKLASFETNIIKHLQSKPKVDLQTNGSVVQTKIFGQDQGLKIKLKSLIHSDNNLTELEYKKYVNVDIEHVEVEEVDHNEEEEQNIEIVEVHEQRLPYTGGLIDFNNFNSEPYRKIAEKYYKQTELDDAYSLVRHELFANLPHSIKYLSPKAAEKLAANLVSWSAINKDNCKPFILKQTSQQEYLLDYEEDENEDKIFCLHEFSPCEESEPYYDVVINLTKDMQDFFGNNVIKLSNLWIKYGDKGVAEFYGKLKTLDDKHHDLSKFIFDNYLNYFDTCETFFNEDFFHAIDKLQNYSQLQISCLKRFLINTGNSQHNLKKTLEDFDVFWHEYKILCKNDEKLINALDTNWSTPKGGQPGVYMQRLLTILKRARNLPSQLTNLDGIVLSQYGAYYASNYEGFTEVHSKMGFEYDPNAIFNSQQYNSNFNLYRVDIKTLQIDAIRMNELTYGEEIKFLTKDDLSESNLPAFIKNFSKIKGISFQEYLEGEVSLLLDKSFAVYRRTLHDDIGFKWIDGSNIKYYLPMTNKSFKHLAYRYIGQQLAGITVSSLNDVWQSWNDKNLSHIFRAKLVSNLTFITSDRYVDTEIALHKNHPDKVTNDLDNLINNTDHTLLEFKSSLILRLNELQANQINFSSQEAVFYQSLQHVGHELQLSGEEKEYFFFKRVTGLEKEFNQSNANVEELNKKFSFNWKPKTKDDPLIYLYWVFKAQEYFIDELHHQLINNKSAAFKFINLVGPHTSSTKLGLYNGSERAFLYAFNTKKFLAEIPAIANTYTDNLLAFSAQLVNDAFNLIFSDFEKTMQSNDKDVEQLKQIRNYLIESTKGESICNGLNYTIQRLIDSKKFFSYQQVLTIFEEVSSVHKDNKLIDVNAIHSILKKYNIPVAFQTSKIFQADDNTIKNNLIEMISTIKSFPAKCEKINFLEEFTETEKADYYEKKQKLEDDLKKLTIAELQQNLIQTLPTCPALLRLAIGMHLKSLLKDILDTEITKILKASIGAEFPLFTERWIQLIEKIEDFQDCKDFVSLDEIVTKVKKLALLLQAVANNSAMTQDETLELFSNLNFSKLDSKTLCIWLDFLTKMPSRDYTPLLISILENPNYIYDQTTFKKLIHLLNILNEKEFPIAAMVNFYQHFIIEPKLTENEYESFIEQLQPHINKNDPLINLCLRSKEFSLSQAMVISADTYELKHREQLANLYKNLQQQNQLDDFLKLNLSPEIKPMVLNILALSSFGAANKSKAPLLAVAEKLKNLELVQLQALNEHYQTTLTSLDCLSNALSELKPEEPFDRFLETIEKSPFGTRDFKSQFNLDEVERVINNSMDLVNNSFYTYQHRKQLMETFLLVNDLGYKIPCFHQKPAKDLSNAEIKQLFLELKANSGKYSKKQKRILALVIMREAMYRATGQFPFSTQMISLIDCMLRQGDVITNIDTGQGKSLIDVMKAAFLYLESDRVDITTSTLVDAERDIENYSPFLSMLGIPYAKKPINANTQLTDFCQNGINFSTFSQLGLRFSKALAENETITVSNKISLVLNESDFSLLDDRSIKRLAKSPEVNITKKHPWIYDAINEFVKTDSFKNKNNATSADEDARNLKLHLIARARVLKKSDKFIKKFDNKTLITWIESAILVNYKLRENFDYVIMPVPGKDGKFFARILMSDDRPSTDSVYGKGIQQLLHASLNENKAYHNFNGEKAFEIIPENNTIISTDNRNLLNYYRCQKGYIWGSSGTVGSTKEIEEQVSKYGFEFSKIQPHQKKQVKQKAVVILKNQVQHYNYLITELQKRRQQSNQKPLIIFCHNIQKAQDIYKMLKENFKTEDFQLNTGVGNSSAEKELIKNAAKPNMCTITTAAIGRNTDIPYDKSNGLDIWFTSIGSTRLDSQKEGRTGRQGSPGDICYFLNEEDQNIRTKEDINTLRENLDQVGRKEREYNETLYNIIGYFLARFREIPENFIDKKQFIHKSWSKFSEDLEESYRELIIKNEFDSERFFNEAKFKFLDLLKKDAPNYKPSELNFDAAVLQKPINYRPYYKHVSIKNCTPAIDIAYQLFHQELKNDPNSTLSLQDKEKLQDELKALFSTKKPQLDQHILFFDNLLKNQVSRDDLKEVYQNYLKSFLNSDQLSFSLKRWFGFNKVLNNIADNKHYLLLFRSLTSIDVEKPLPGKDEIKRIAIAMIDEYLKNSWWIGSSKRRAANELKDDLSRSTEIDEIITNICQSQIIIAEKDIAANKNRFGNSRFQNTLTNILILAASLGVKANTTELITKLSSSLNAVTGKNPRELNHDEIKSLAAASTGNAKVLAKSLSKALKLTAQDINFIEGMEGRNTQKKQ